MEPRERVITKSIELFTQSGIRLVTMDQIAAESGMSKRTIYELFKDKDGLVRECLEIMKKEHLQDLQELLAGSSNVIEAMFKVSEHGERKKASFNRLFFEDIKKMYPVIWGAVRWDSGKGEESFSSTLLRRGVEEGVFLQDLNVKVVDAFMQMMSEIFHHRQMFPEDTTHEDLVRNIIIPYYLGISTPKGQGLIRQYWPLA